MFQTGRWVYARLDLIVTVMYLTILSRSVMLFDCVYKLNLESAIICVSKEIIFYLPDFSKKVSSYRLVKFHPGGPSGFVRRRKQFALKFCFPLITFS